MGIFDKLHSWTTLLSLVLTPVTIIAAVAVVMIWFDSTKRAFLATQTRTAAQWLIMGVMLSFFGSIFDNAYWGAAWTADYLQHPIRDDLFKYGVYSNAPFRQLCTIGAAFCHIRAGAEGGSRVLLLVAMASLLAAMLTIVGLASQAR